MEELLHTVCCGIKDMEEIDENKILPSEIAKMGYDFLDWIESFYDNDGNYTDIGLSEDGQEHLNKYAKNYGL